MESFLTAILSVLGIAGVSMCAQTPGSRQLQLLYQWSVLKFATPPGYVADPSYMANETFITGLETFGKWLYISTPRLKGNNPSTLSIVPKDGQIGSSPVLQPYPDISWNTVNGSSTNCNTTLVSVHRTKRDKCNRLWVLDAGTMNILDGNPIRFCQPKIVIIDLLTNKPVDRIIIPDTVLTPITVLQNLVLDDVILVPESSAQSGSPCDKVFVYMADSSAPAVVSLDYQKKAFYRLSHPYMYPDPAVPFFTVNGESFTSFNGIIGMDVTGQNSKRSLYFSPFSSNYVYSMPTKIAQKPPMTINPLLLLVTTAFTKSGPGIALNNDTSDGCLLFNPINNDTIVGWDPNTQRQQVLTQNGLLCVVFDMRQDSVNNKITYIADSCLQKYKRNKASYTYPNIRIYTLTRQ